MKSQMELALTIGAVIIGAVLLISALVLSWEMLLPTTDSCRIAAGIGYDIGALQSSLFTVPGDINIHYVPPSICEFPYQMGIPGSKLICQPLQGGNPNITSITTTYETTHGYGFSFVGPTYLSVAISFDWINNLNHNKVESNTIRIKEIATSSPGLEGTEYLSEGEHYITISKTQTPYGDVISPLADSEEDAIEDMVTAMIASAHNGLNYSSGYIDIPENWFFTYNSTSTELCEYRIVLNAYLYAPGDYADYIGYCKPSGHTKEQFDKKFGFDIYGSCVDETYSIQYSPNSYDDCLLINDNSGTTVYNPWNQTNVEKYGTGFLKIRCFNVSKITQDENITSVTVDIQKSQEITSNFYSSYRSVNDAIMYRYNATYNNGEVNLKVWPV